MLSEYAVVPLAMFLIALLWCMLFESTLKSVLKSLYFESPCERPSRAIWKVLVQVIWKSFECPFERPLSRLCVAVRAFTRMTAAYFRKALVNNMML